MSASPKKPLQFLAPLTLRHTLGLSLPEKRGSAAPEPQGSKERDMAERNFPD